MSIIIIDPIQRTDAGWSYTGRFRCRMRDQVDVSYTLDHPPKDEKSIADAFLLTFLLPAMRVGEVLEVEGEVDEVLLDHLDRFQEIWARWLPGKLRKVPIRVARRIPREPRKSIGAIACFSGGVDSSYTMLKHGSESWLPEEQRLPLKRLLMIHGMDIPVNDPETFERAFCRSRVIANAYDLPLSRLSTDIRKLGSIFKLRWGEELHGSALAASLMIAGGDFSRGIIPSTYAATDPVYPWASNALTDPLLGSSLLEIVHDGDEANKLEKVARVSHAPAIADHLRVCWEGVALDQNCGHCFKCMASRIAFALCGKKSPACFPGALELARIPALKLKNKLNYRLFEAYRRRAQQQQDADFVDVLNTCLRRNRRNTTWREVKVFLRRITRTY
jgi:hypothetical protein